MVMRAVVEMFQRLGSKLTPQLLLKVLSVIYWENWLKIDTIKSASVS